MSASTSTFNQYGALQSLRARMIGIVDSIPETAGLGVVSYQDRHIYRLRAEGNSGATVVFETGTPHSGQSDDQAQLVPARGAHTSPSTEWLSAGFNCGGAVLAWIGVAGASALAPVTGGVSGFAAAALWGGALASSAQCAVSGYRIYNMQSGRSDINDILDDSKLYVYTMGGLDVVGLIGAGGALKEIKETHAIITEAGTTWKASGWHTISRPMRKRLTIALELEGGKRASSIDINRVLRQRLLDATAGAIGIIGSSATGLLHDVAVWITSEADPDMLPE